MKTVLHILIIILLTSAICSCASPQEVEYTGGEKTSNRYERLFMATDSMFGEISAAQRELKDRLAELKIENKTVYYSAPDSTGRQHPVSISETVARGSEKESSRTDTHMDAVLQKMMSRVDSLSDKVDAVLREQRKTVELSWWDRNKGCIDTAVQVMVLIAFGYMIYKLKK